MKDNDSRVLDQQLGQMYELMQAIQRREFEDDQQ